LDAAVEDWEKAEKLSFDFYLWRPIICQYERLDAMKHKVVLFDANIRCKHGIKIVAKGEFEVTQKIRFKERNPIIESNSNSKQLALKDESKENPKHENDDDIDSSKGLDDSCIAGSFMISDVVLKSLSIVLWNTVRHPHMTNYSEIVFDGIELESLLDVLWWKCTDEIREEANPIKLAAIAHVIQNDNLFEAAMEQMLGRLSVENALDTGIFLDKYEVTNAQGIRVFSSWIKANRKNGDVEEEERKAELRRELKIHCKRVLNLV